MNPTPQDLTAIAIGTLLGAFLWKNNRLFGAIGGGAIGFGVSYAMAQQQMAQPTLTPAEQTSTAVQNVAQQAVASFQPQGA
jgi:protein involved in ribonucleotide reduction